MCLLDGSDVKQNCTAQLIRDNTKQIPEEADVLEHNGGTVVLMFHFISSQLAWYGDIHSGMETSLQSAS